MLNRILLAALAKLLPRLPGAITLSWLALAGLGAPAHAAQDSLIITTNHYRVTGSTLSEVRESINRARPGGLNSSTDTLTTWQIQWRTRVSTVNGRCQLDSLTVATRICVTMPSWRPPTNALPRVIKRWTAYYTALLKHEMNHAESGKLAAQQLRKRLFEIPPQADCDLLRRRIQDVADEVIATFRKRDADYDLETDHGLKEGARLP